MSQQVDVIVIRPAHQIHLPKLDPKRKQRNGEKATGMSGEGGAEGEGWGL